MANVKLTVSPAPNRTIHCVRMTYSIALIGILLIMSATPVATAQVIWAGFKAGGQVNLPKIDDIHFRDTAKVIPAPGFNVGLVVFFKVKNRYFLQTEYIYSMKSKVLSGKGKKDDELSDKVVYNYFEVPILFTRQSKGHMLGGEFKWYFGAGPNIAYLLGGRGTIASSELKENNIPSLDYRVAFASRGGRQEMDVVYYPGTNRLQFGINVGAGFIVEPSPKQRVVIDLRYTFDQTAFGKGSADYQFPYTYNDNLKFRNRTLRFSVMYLLEYNISKKSRHTGKSNKRIK